MHYRQPARGEVQQHYEVNRAAIAIVEQRPGQALAPCWAAYRPAAPMSPIYRRLRAEAYLQESEFLSQCQERVLLDPLLTDPERNWKTSSLSGKHSTVSPIANCRHSAPRRHRTR